MSEADRGMPIAVTTDMEQERERERERNRILTISNIYYYLLLNPYRKSDLYLRSGQNLKITNVLVLYVKRKSDKMILSCIVQHVGYK